MKTFQKNFTIQTKRLVYFYGEAQQKGNIEKAEAYRKENDPKKVAELKKRYGGERSEELVKCDLSKKNPDPYLAEQAQKTEKRIKDETVEPDKLEGKYLNAEQVNDNMRKLYKILGKDWDQVKADEAKKAEEDKAAKEKKAEEDKAKAQPAAPEVDPNAPLKFSEIKRIATDSIDKKMDENTKEAVDAVIKELESKIVGKEFKKIDDVKTAIQVAINNMDQKYLMALAGKDMKFSAGNYTFDFKFLNAPGSKDQKYGIQEVNATAIKKVDVSPGAPKEANPDDKGKPGEGNGKPGESKEVTEIRSKVETALKGMYEQYSKMSKEELIKNGDDNKLKLAQDLGLSLKQIEVGLSADLAKLDQSYKIDQLLPNTDTTYFNKNGINVQSFGNFIENLYKEKNIESKEGKDTPNALQYVLQFEGKANEVGAKYDNKDYVAQKGITTYEDFVKNYEADVKSAVATIDKKYVDKIEWNKLPDTVLQNSLYRPVHFQMGKDKPPVIFINEAASRTMWDVAHPPKLKEEPKPKDQKPEEPKEEQPDPNKMKKLPTKTMEAAINKGFENSFDSAFNNDPFAIGTAIKIQLQKLPMTEQYLIPTTYMTPQGFKLEMLHYGPTMKVRVEGITEGVARKYVQKWETQPEPTAQANEKKWSKVLCVDVYGKEKPKPEGWLKTAKSAAAEKEKNGGGPPKPGEAGAKSPDVKPGKPGFEASPGAEESPTEKEVRGKVETSVKKVFDQFSNMSKEDLIKNGFDDRFTLLHAIALNVKTEEKTLMPDLAKLDKTLSKVNIVPGVDATFNKGGICLEKPAAWISDLYKKLGVVEKGPEDRANAFKYTQEFTTKMIALNEKYSSKDFLAKEGIKSYEDFAKKYNQELTTYMGTVDKTKIEWANLPGNTLVYPNYSYASFRLEKDKPVVITVNEGGMRTLWDKANTPKTDEEKAKEDAPDNVDKAKARVEEESKAIFKKYTDLSAKDLVAKGFDNKIKLSDAIMADFKAADVKLLPELKDIKKSYSFKINNDVSIWFNQYGVRPVGMDKFMDGLYKDKKVKNIDTEKGQTPNARKAIDTIMSTMRDTSKKCTDQLGVSKTITTFGEYYKFMTDEITKSVKGLDPKTYEGVEWDKLPDNMIRTPYTAYAEVTKTKDGKEPDLKFNMAYLKGMWDSYNQPGVKKTEFTDLDEAKISKEKADSQPDSPETTEKAKGKVDEEMKALFKKYNDMTPDQIIAGKLDNRTLLVSAIMEDIKGVEGRLQFDLANLNVSHITDIIKDVPVQFNKYGVRPTGLAEWVKKFYKDKKIEDKESKDTPNTRKAEDTISKTIKTINDKYTNSTRADLQKQGILNFDDYYKKYCADLKTSVDALGTGIFDKVEWDKLPGNTFKSPYTYFAEVSRTKDNKDLTYNYNKGMIKMSWDYLT